MLMLSHGQRFADPWTIAHQAPLRMEFSRLQTRILERVAISYSGDPPNPEIESVSLASPELAGGFFTISIIWETQL